MRALLFCLLVCATAITGCTSTATSNTARTATEQLLISNAIDDSLSNVDFGAFAGHNVFLEEKYMESVDKNYTIGSIRHRLMMQGVSIVDKKENSDICLELRSGGVGTDSSKMFLGIPEVAIPGMVTLPELRFVSKESQNAAAKLGIVAYHTKSGQILGDGGVSLAQSDRNNWYVLGIGPYENGSLKKEIADSVQQASYTPNRKMPRQVAFLPSYSSGAGGAYDDTTARIRLAGEEQPQQ
ncbi:MAG: hypothetical protein P8M30_19230 [Planctomycetaceae bacterium]|nr:hypothetical protein [Planctomycetaceae bacterium]